MQSHTGCYILLLDTFPSWSQQSVESIEIWLTSSPCERHTIKLSVSVVKGCNTYQPWGEVYPTWMRIQKDRVSSQTRILMQSLQILLLLRDRSQTMSWWGHKDIQLSILNLEVRMGQDNDRMLKSDDELAEAGKAVRSHWSQGSGGVYE